MNRTCAISSCLSWIQEGVLLFSTKFCKLAILFYPPDLYMLIFHADLWNISLRQMACHIWINIQTFLTSPKHSMKIVYTRTWKDKEISHAWFQVPTLINVTSRNNKATRNNHPKSKCHLNPNNYQEPSTLGFSDNYLQFTWSKKMVSKGSFFFFSLLHFIHEMGSIVVILNMKKPSIFYLIEHTY